MVLVDVGRFREVQGEEITRQIMELYRNSNFDFVIDDIGPDTRWKPSGRSSVYDHPGWFSHEEAEDEWQVIWKELRVVGHPLESGWENLKNLRIPDADAPGRFDKARASITANPHKYHLGRIWFTLFERMWMIRGFDNMLMDPYLYFDEFVELREMVMDYNLRLLRNWIDAGVDGVYISDDWGGQQTMLINPEDWRKYYRQSYSRIIDLAHASGVDVWMHSCGHVTELIPDLIDIGLDVLNPIQPQAMDLEDLSRRFAGKICFYGGVDVQGTLPHGSPDDIREEVKKLIRLFRTDQGGFIGETSHTVLPDTPIENIRALFSAFETYCGDPRLAWP
jgi:uroporphyrinogen decarboxylase